MLHMKVLFTALFVVLVAFVSMSEAGASERETVASCYGFGDGLAGRLTASGDVFDPLLPTVAHRTIEFGTPLVFRVGEREVLAVVNDRGPFVGDREFDLSCGAMVRLGLLPGVHPVLVRDL